MQTTQEISLPKPLAQPTPPAGLWSLLDWSDLFRVLKGDAEALRQLEQYSESKDPQQSSTSI
jgi:hypothetical protein